MVPAAAPQTGCNLTVWIPSALILISGLEQGLRIYILLGFPGNPQSHFFGSKVNSGFGVGRFDFRSPLLVKAANTCSSAPVCQLLHESGFIQGWGSVMLSTLTSLHCRRGRS